MGAQQRAEKTAGAVRGLGLNLALCVCPSVFFLGDLNITFEHIENWARLVLASMLCIVVLVQRQVALAVRSATARTKNMFLSVLG